MRKLKPEVESIFEAIFENKVEILLENDKKLILRDDKGNILLIKINADDDVVYSINSGEFGKFDRDVIDLQIKFNPDALNIDENSVFWKISEFHKKCLFLFVALVGQSVVTFSSGDFLR
ncbi:hypothetical protein [Methanotorris formicicus]|uniref:Uncharacterized protein n=1 Tax=Methanotorris formicicus Mc-S-70 TaxID=647171 RepID=H1L0Y8_9EURY|nr:hypothetical protein [Methanotorris formicicus]EHP84294.1 hypothetical protein MetfoDRAFT_1712 [Methanotorris formicicus Mc-S-70]